MLSWPRCGQISSIFGLSEKNRNTSKILSHTPFQNTYHISLVTDSSDDTVSQSSIAPTVTCIEIPAEHITMQFLTQGT